MRGPISVPRAIASRSGLSTGAPSDCTVVIAALDRPHRILRRIQHRLLRRLLPIGLIVMRPPILRIEVPPDMHMRIDPARHQRPIAEVDGDVLSLRRLRHDPHDLPALDNHRRIVRHMPAPIDHPRRANDDGLGGEGGGEEEGEEEGFHARSLWTCSAALMINA